MIDNWDHVVIHICNVVKANLPTKATTYTYKCLHVQLHQSKHQSKRNAYANAWACLPTLQLPQSVSY